MVHRAPDSRLLTNLIGNEKEYAKHLAHLFPLSHTALASLSAYAAASPTSPARTIAAVVDLLASADDALQRYHHAIETWRDQLLSLKDLEDDLSAVLRDRDILVTRLIKVSKTTREAHRSSRLVTPLTGPGSASFSSLPSTNSTSASASGSSPATANTKLAQAQAELQACEAHLVTKERELDARRISIARDGLGARCRALLDCGWVWGEMGKQGLKALQALSLNGITHPADPTYVSDNSSITPSQSASHTPAWSTETSQEGATSKRHEPDPSTQEAQGDVTITLPPAHAISDLTLPTSVLSQPSHNGVPAIQTQNGISTKPALAPAPRRKRMKRPRRPPSQLIAEVSDEGSDVPTNRNAKPGTSPSSRTPFPVGAANGTQDTSSDDEHPAGSFKVVENDPFQVIRQSIVGPSPSASHLPTVPSVLAGVENSPSRMASTNSGASLGRGTGAAKRERRTSIAFFGSLRGLFRKPKERESVYTEWDEARSSPPKPNGNGRGWVTRTDARIKGRSGEADSDEESTAVGNVVRGNSGARLRKGRPRGTHGSIPSQDATGVGVDGWVTDSHGPRASSGTGLDRSRTRRGTIKQKRTSVADLRGSDQGHTDGEVDGGLSLDRVSSKGKGEGEVVKEEPGRMLARRGSASKGVPNDTKPIAGLEVQHRRAATTTAATSSRTPSEIHRRSASSSLVDPHVTFMSASTSSTGGSTSWRKPPPEFEPVPLTSRSKMTSTELPSKPQARRPVGNGRGTYAQSQSLMSLVADVTGQRREEQTRSLDVPRAPGSVLDETTEVGRRASLTVGMGEEGRGVVKLPLRSALRNPSRTPSPAPAALPAPVAVTVGVKKTGLKEEEEEGGLRDSMSISSYETVKESLEGEGEEGEGVVSPEALFTFPPPPVTDPPTVVRRKSVRVSLQPTFSPSPPAFYDEDGDGYIKSAGEPEDVWADSTSEEEVYRRAKGLLSVASKGKGRSSSTR